MAGRLPAFLTREVWDLACLPRAGETPLLPVGTPTLRTAGMEDAWAVPAHREVRGGAVPHGAIYRAHQPGVGRAPGISVKRFGKVPLGAEKGGGPTAWV